MKRIIISGLCLFLIGCASTTFYSETGTPVAIFQGDYTALKYENSKEGIKWSASTVNHSIVTSANVKAAAGLTTSLIPLQ